MTRGGAGERRVLDEAGGVGAMTGVLAIMLFLTVLAGALGLGTAAAARLLDRDLAGKLTVEVTGGDAAAARVLAALRALSGVVATPVDRAQLAALLQPWLGSDAADPALPVPAMIDVAVAQGDGARVAAAVRAADPTATVEGHARGMAPVAALMRTLTWLGAGLVALMAAASAAVVVLAARAGLEAHRGTIEVMHLMGATDVQVARLFQRRLALDAALGGAAGAGAAALVVLAIGSQLSRLGSELVGAVTLARGDWLLLACLPLGFVLLATVAARVAVVRALGRML